jgi:hypothetical protein
VPRSVDLLEINFVGIDHAQDPTRATRGLAGPTAPASRGQRLVAQARR